MADEVTQGESSATRKNRATGAISISFGMASSPVRASWLLIRHRVWREAFLYVLIQPR